MALDDPDKLNRLARDRGEKPLPARFYETVSVNQDPNGYSIALDDRPIKTPMKLGLVVPNQALADAIAQEWQDQTSHIDPAAMPMTRLANTAIDRVMPDADRIIDEIADYAGSDLLCYRSDEPEKLVERQNAAWDPLLQWCGRELGAPLIAISGLMHEDQPDASIAAIKSHLAKRGAFTLTGLHNLTTLTGSAVLAMAIEAAVIEPDAAWRAAHVDEDWNLELWGEDGEAAQRRALRRREFDASIRFMTI